jgi:hypothetical protein
LYFLFFSHHAILVNLTEWLRYKIIRNWKQITQLPYTLQKVFFFCSTTRREIFLGITLAQTQTLNTQAHSPPMNTRMYTISLWAPQKKTDGISQDWRSHHRCLAVKGTSPTTKSTTPLNPRINLGKYEHPCPRFLLSKIKIYRTSWINRKSRIYQKYRTKFKKIIFFEKNS